MPTIDLRSDAITRPTEAMWAAMSQAQLGWALAGEDSSVNQLETYAANLAGKEAALFTPTGSMANLVALMTHTRRGEQVIAEASSHILWSEEWGFAYVCGVAPRPIAGVLGAMAPEAIEAAIQDKRFSHQPPTCLICLENTHNAAGGTIIDARQTAAVASLAARYEIPVHMDGVRIFNACVALGQSLQQLVANVDSVTVGLNKGLSAPAGALLCGSKNFIERSRINLRRLGGQSIHQAGILAAAGLVALKEMPAQLSHDHRRAKMLAAELAQINGLRVNLDTVQTNIVMARLEKTPAQTLLNRLAQADIRAYQYAADTVRFVTHRHVTDADIERVIATTKTIMEKM